MNELYYDLIFAIVRQAYKDLRNAHGHLKRNPVSEKDLDTIDEIRKFFHSPWCEFLIGIDGNYVYQRLEEQING